MAADLALAASVLDLGPSAVALAGAVPGGEREVLAGLGGLCRALAGARRPVRVESLSDHAVWIYGGG